MKTSILIIFSSLFLSQLSLLGESGCELAQKEDCCKAPSVVKFSQPELPTGLLKPGESAEIVVKCAISEEGKLIGAKTVSTSHQDLETVVLAAIKNWKFDASLHMGEPQRSTLNVPFKFTVAAK